MQRREFSKGCFFVSSGGDGALELAGIAGSVLQNKRGQPASPRSDPPRKAKSQDERSRGSCRSRRFRGLALRESRGPWGHACRSTRASWRGSRRPGTWQLGRSGKRTTQCAASASSLWQSHGVQSKQRRRDQVTFIGRDVRGHSLSLLISCHRAAGRLIARETQARRWPRRGPSPSPSSLRRLPLLLLVTLLLHTTRTPSHRTKATRRRDRPSCSSVAERRRTATSSPRAASNTESAHPKPQSESRGKKVRPQSPSLLQRSHD